MTTPTPTPTQPRPGPLDPPPGSPWPRTQTVRCPTPGCDTVLDGLLDDCTRPACVELSLDEEMWHVRTEDV